MRNLKRALSLALASVMLLGMMVVGTGASYADVTSEENQEAIEVLQAIGVMVGDNNGNFNPDALVNREQMATIMCQLLDYTVSTYTGTTNFTDVSAWALPYVEACYANGIIAGYSDTQFGGTDNVTTAQAALMIMKALGYFQEAGDFGGDWVVSTVRQGAQIQLFDGVTNGANEALTRNDVAQLVLNGLTADSVEIRSHDLVSDGNGGFTTKANYDSRAKVASIDTLQDNSSAGLQLGEELFDGDLVETGDSDDFGRPATTWTFEGDKVGTYTDTPDGVVVVDENNMTLDDILTDGDYFNLTNDGTADNGKRNNRVNLTASSDSGNVSGTAKFVKKTADAAYANASTVPVYVGDTVEIYKNQYGFVETVVVARYELAEVDLLNDSVSSSDSAKGTEYYVDLVDLDGSAVGIGTYKDNDIAGFDADIFAEGNMVAVAMNSDEEIIDSYALETVSGGISAYKITSTSSPYVTVDGNQYNLANDALTNGSPDEDTVDFVDGTYNVYVDANGYALGIEGTYKVSIDDVYYVTGFVGTKSGTFGSASYYAQAVSLTDGTVQEIQLETSNYEDLSGKSAYDGVNSELNNLNGTPGLYYFTDNDAGNYTINDDSLGDDNAYEAKSNNDKFTAEAYSGDGDDLAVAIGALPTAGLKRSDTSTSVGSDKLYLNGETQYILVEKSEDDIDVSVRVGGVNAAQAGITAYAVYLKDGGAKVANYVVLASANSIGGNADTTSVVYLASTPNVKVNGGWQTDLYLLDGTVLEDVTVASNYAGEKFYNYEEDDDGIITLTDDVANVYAGESGDVSYENETGKIEDQNLDSIYGDGITLKDFVYSGSDVYTVADVDASEAVFVDTRSGSDRDADPYKTAITTLAQLKTALDRGVVKVDLFLDDESVLLIAVIEVNYKGENAVSDAVGDGYTFAGSVVQDGNTVTATGSSSSYANTNPAVDAVTKSYIADLARFLGGLYRSGAAEVIVYNNVTYTWNTSGVLAGSNWEDASGNTLVKAIDTAWGALTADSTATATLSVDGVTMTYTVVIP